MSNRILENTSALSIAKYTAICLLFTLAIIVSLIIIGWVTSNLFLTHLFGTAKPMSMSISIGFLFIILGLLGRVYDYKKISFVIGVFVIIFAMVLILPIEMRNFKWWIFKYKPQGGVYLWQISPYSAICFLIAGINLIYNSCSSISRHKYFVLIPLNIFILIVTYISFFDSLVGYQTISWWENVNYMSLYTSFGFLIWTSSLIILLLIEIIQISESRYFLVPIFSFLGCYIVFLFLWQATTLHEVKVIKKNTTNISYEIIKEFKDKITSEFLSLNRLSSRHSITDVNNKLWIKDAGLYLKHHESFELIGKVNDSCSLSESYKKNGASISTLLLQEKLKYMNPRKSGVSVFPVKLETQNYLLVFFPMSKGGFILSVYNCDKLATSILSNNLYKNFNSEILLNGRVIFKEIYQDNPYLKPKWRTNEHFEAFNSDWDFDIWPSWSSLEDFKSKTSIILLLAGFVISTFIAVVISQYQLYFKKNKELELAYNELEEFSYSIAHDLKAPLRHISGFIHLLEVNNSFEEKTQRYLNIIDTSSKKMDKLIDAMLYLSELSRKKIAKQNISLNKVINTAVKYTEQKNPNRTISWDIPVLPEVHADYDLFLIMFKELFENAVKFSVDSQPLKLIIKAKRGMQGLNISIQDNGIGLKQQYSKKIFNMFHHLNKEEEYEGIGSGLTFVKKIVQKHGGKIWVESNENIGATIHINIPNIISEKYK
ncbi:MAG: ATP-binding protein [Legionellaceae bacterium]|nr:ATP-binding protein [Legionellaceae bacterium]